MDPVSSDLMGTYGVPPVEPQPAETPPPPPEEPEPVTPPPLPVDLGQTIDLYQ